MDEVAGYGLYLHVPFCRHRCDYCAFAVWTDRTGLADRYLDACRRQIRRARADGMPEVTSVFVGGGTPSLVPAESLMAVLATVPTVVGAEITVEANPDDVTPRLLAAYVAGGVTRLSLGAQSTEPEVLRSLGRTHGRKNVDRAAEAAHAGGLAFNVDLIYGAASESVEQWSATLDAVVALGPDHVSAYALTVEPATALAADHDRHPDDDDQADKYLLATSTLAAAGFECYEISNWARPGRRCRHNLLTWRGGDYLGVGCAAHSHHAGRRAWNVRSPERYIERIESGRSPEIGCEVLPDRARRRERDQLGLRTADGVGVGAFDPGVLDDLGSLVTVGGDRVTLTPAGRLLANEVTLRLRT